MSRPALLVVLLVAGTACKAPATDKDKAPPASALLPPTAPAAATTEEPAPPPAPLSATIVSFTKDTLVDECTDIILTPPEGVAPSPALLDTMLAPLLKAKKGNKISRSCADQFASMPTLATCSTRAALPITADAGLPPGTYQMSVVARYYNLDTLTTTNTYMKNCFDLKGDWQGVDKNSSEYRDAVRARARRDVDKAMKIVGQ